MSLSLRGRAVELVRRRGEGPTLVLLHGAGGCAEGWEPVLEPLEGRDVLAPTLPGRRGSEGAAFEDAREAAAWVGELVAACGVQRWIACGYSYGGSVAIECALAAPPGLVGLALISSGAKLRVHPGVLQAAEDAVARGEPLALGGLVYRPGTDAARIAKQDALDRTVPPEAARADWRACDRFDRLADVARLTLPTCVIGGEEDALTPPKYAQFLVRSIAGARHVRIADAGHALVVERPLEVGAALLAFAVAHAG